MKKTLIFIGIWAITLGAFGQTGSLSITPGSFRMISAVNQQSTPDSIITQDADTLSFRATFGFTGTGTLSDQLGFIIARDSNGTIIHSDSLLQDTMTTMVNGDTTTVVVKDFVDSSNARYSGGGGGAILVIVWPVARFTPLDPASDSVKANIIVDIHASIPPEWKNELQFLYFPNPVTTTLNISYKTIQKDVEYVRLFDMEGREVFKQRGAVNTVDLTHLNAGYYFLHIQGKDKEAVVKLEKR